MFTTIRAPAKGKLPAHSEISIFLDYTLSRLENRVKCFSLKGFSTKDPAELTASSGSKSKRRELMPVMDLIK